MVTEPFVGDYDCQVFWSSTSYENDTFFTTTGTYRDTLHVRILPDPEELMITGIIQSCDIIGYPVILNPTDSTFENVGSRVYGRYCKDSIYCYFQSTPAALYWKKMNGKRIIK